MLENNFTTIYDLQAMGFQLSVGTEHSIFMLSLGLLFVASNVVVRKMGLLKSKVKKWQLLFMIVWISIISLSVIGGYRGDQKEYQKLAAVQCQPVEGVIQQHPASFEDSFSLDGVNFEPSGNLESLGFQQTPAQGSPAQLGQTARICYVEQGRENQIVKLEIANFTGQVQDYSREGLAVFFNKFSFLFGEADTLEEEVELSLEEKASRNIKYYITAIAVLALFGLANVVVLWKMKGAALRGLFVQVHQIPHAPFKVPKGIRQEEKKNIANFMVHLVEGGQLWARYYGFEILKARGLAICMQLSTDGRQVEGTTIHMSKIAIFQQIGMGLAMLGFLYLMMSQGQIGIDASSFITLAIAVLFVGGITYFNFRKTKKTLRLAWEEAFAPAIKPTTELTEEP